MRVLAFVVSSISERDDEKTVVPIGSDVEEVHALGLKKFVEEAKHRVARGELRFDMFEGEYTHESDSCTFETLLSRFQLHDPGLQTIAEIVHELDCKDGRYEHGETAGIRAMVAGLVASYDDDLARIEHGSRLFDHLLTAFQGRSAGPASQIGESTTG